MPDHNVNLNVPILEKSLDLLKGFLEKVIGPTANEIGQYFGDELKIRRLKNQIRNFEKVKAIVEKENINIKQIDLKALFPYMQGVSLEEDETLQDKWASLFVNYIDSSKNLVSHVYPNILAQLSGNEIRILDYMDSTNKNLYRKDYKKNDIDYQDEELANLLRLGLLEPAQNYSIYDTPSDPKIEELQPEQYYLTVFGISFINACKR